MSELQQSPAVGDTPPDVATVKENRKAWRRRAFWRAVLIGLAFLAGFIVFGIVAIQVWEYSNSVGFCTNACHDVHPEETVAFEDSYHAEIKCTECHMGRLGTLRGIILKAGHFRHLPEVIFKNYERPLHSVTMRPASESCEKCHYPPAFHGDRVLSLHRFGLGVQSIERQIYLIMKTGGGKRAEGLGYGIHWHIENPVEYIASDENKQEIRWVRTTLPDGRTAEYNDVLKPLTAAEIAQAEKRTMDCVDCHNRVGHPFPSPESLIDTALADGRLSMQIPNIKDEMRRVLSADYASQEAALQAIDGLKQTYAAGYPEAASQYAGEIDAAIQLGKEFVPKLIFSESGVTWKDFPDNGKHKDFAGCFRCHDGKHLSAEGESIRLHCNICHSIPESVAVGSRPPQMPAGTVQEPDFHLATTFIADHRFQAGEACVACHGEIGFGSDNSNFCANPSCHGQAWPAVNLNAAFPHPVALEGRHAQVLCSSCHKGEAKPEYKCSNCHEPPQATHFGDDCERCHAPAGFGQATMADFQHPVALEGKHASLECNACHAEGKDLTYKCSECHEPPSKTHFGPECETCHTPEGFQGAVLPPGLHPVPLVGAHQRATCDVCHADGQRVPDYVCSNCHRAPADHFVQSCDTCHTPEGWAQSASGLVQASPEIPHPLEGMGDCMLCHAEGKLKPAPANHTEFALAQCALCHKPED